MNGYKKSKILHPEKEYFLSVFLGLVIVSQTAWAEAHPTRLPENFSVTEQEGLGMLWLMRLATNE